MMHFNSEKEMEMLRNNLSKKERKNRQKKSEQNILIAVKSHSDGFNIHKSSYYSQQPFKLR